METTYLVEIRLGRTKWRIKQVTASIAGHFGLAEHQEKHPHVTIFGPLVLCPPVTEEQFLAALDQVACRYGPVPFFINGWETREGMHGSVIAFSVRPSEPLTSLVRDVARSLIPLCRSLNAWDPTPELKWFHVTIANRLDRGKARRVFSALTSSGITGQTPGRNGTNYLTDFIRALFHRKHRNFCPVLLDEDGLRLTVMKGDDILAEYDFLRKEWLFIAHDHDCAAWQQTLRAFRLASGMECTSVYPKDPDDIFVISDLHLGHANIIRSCSRPFLYSRTDEMDSVLIQNWNAVVSPATPVYHLGDLRYGKNAQPAEHYTRQLKGNVTYLAGNHDAAAVGTVTSSVIDYHGFRFLLIHDPADAPPGFDGWIIHGHHHNNDLSTFPFLDLKNRRVNVCAEVVGYVPVPLREICSLITVKQSSRDPDPVLLRTLSRN